MNTEDLNPKIFYDKLMLEGDVILEKIWGTTEDGDRSEFYNFDDAEMEASEYYATLDEFGHSYIHYEGKIYVFLVYYQNGEGVDVKEMTEEDKKELIRYIEDAYGSIEWAIEELPFLENIYDE